MTDSRRYRGLLIGNATYPRDPHCLPALNGPLADITHLKQVLTDRQVGLFDSPDVETLSDYGIQDLREKVDEFFTTAARGDVLLLYYSGHGQLDERGTLYLCAQDTRTAGLRATALSAIEINNIIEGSPAATTVIILDCCYSGAFKGITPSASVAGRGRYVLTSSRSTQLARAATRPGQPSPFTRQLVRALRSAQPGKDAGYVTVVDVYRQVHHGMTLDAVIAPQLKFVGEGDVAIARRPVPHQPMSLKETEPPSTPRAHSSPQELPPPDGSPAMASASSLAVQQMPLSSTQLVEAQTRESVHSESLKDYARSVEEGFGKAGQRRGQKILAWMGSIYTVAIILGSCWLMWQSVDGVEGRFDQAAMTAMPPLVFLSMIAFDAYSRIHGFDLPWYAYPFVSLIVSIGPMGYTLNSMGDRGVSAKIAGICFVLAPFVFAPYLFRAAVMDACFPELHSDIKERLRLERAEAADSQRKRADSILLADSIRRYYRLKGEPEE
ncbi:caspase family protein [Streptomyces klenkii]|uniref:Caspase family protein n=1 Tax=Streptomyces klenkii TaxID=1420899 RepID=A0A3B0BRD8_9ACTN|nr:caspase family protein [Streptomyces klenkii]RKN74607.1 caspase family protein [Streptomyces klenkii]